MNADEPRPGHLGQHGLEPPRQLGGSDRRVGRESQIVPQRLPSLWGHVAGKQNLARVERPD
jgi:hypothetical protein